MSEAVDYAEAEIGSPVTVVDVGEPRTRARGSAAVRARLSHAPHNPNDGLLPRRIRAWRPPTSNRTVRNASDIVELVNERRVFAEHVATNSSA